MHSELGGSRHKASWGRKRVAINCGDGAMVSECGRNNCGIPSKQAVGNGRAESECGLGHLALEAVRRLSGLAG